MVSFEVSPEEMATIRQIARRATREGIQPMVEHEMDIIACHANGCPLDLDKLLAFDAFNFNHDVFGIMRHLNKETGQLEDCFWPRSAQQEEHQ